jgi:hypothetical protein
MQASPVHRQGRAGRAGHHAAASFTALALAFLACGAAGAEASVLSGTVKSGPVSIERAPVTLFKAVPNGSAPVAIGRARTDRRGRFAIRYRRPRGANVVLYAVSGVPRTNRRRAVRLATVLGAGPYGRRVRLNERTTVAAAFGEAQFVAGWRIRGNSPGPQNAALMAHNLASPATGLSARVLNRAPNGRVTPTRETFNSLANMLAGCARVEGRCPRLFAATRVRGERRPTTTLQAFANVARNPGDRVRRLFRLSRTGPKPYQPALKRSKRPDNWSLFLRFVGDGKSLDGPGNIAFDAAGNAWVANNYEYSRKPGQPVCGGRIVAVFEPDGSFAPFSPIDKGGISGSGYGITFDPSGHVWVGNFGFASPAPGCPTDRQPPHDTVSKYTAGGRALSGPNGIDAGSLSWPQGTVSNADGDIWIANCGPYGDPLSEVLPHDSFTIYPGGDPSQAKSIRDPNLDKPFDIAFNRRGNAFISSTVSHVVGMYDADGTPTAKSPITGGGLNFPMGVAADTRGNIWVANSGVVNLPCPGTTLDLSSLGGSVTLIGHGGHVRSPGSTVENPRGGFVGGGAKVPWGIAVDGDDNVWVSNFDGRRVSKFCGTRPRNCPKGLGTGDPISPAGGYGFNGLQRNTAVEVDPSGNVWITNNWKRLADIKLNPGGYHMVVMVGAAAPVRTPLIGQPEPLT